MLQVTAAKNAWFVTIDVLIMSSNFKIMHAMIVTI